MPKHLNYVFPKFQSAYGLHKKVFNLQHTVPSSNPSLAFKYLPQNLLTPTWTVVPVDVTTAVTADAAASAASPLGIWKGIHWTPISYSNIIKTRPLKTFTMSGFTCYGFFYPIAT